MKYNYPEHFSKNASSAIKLAKQLKQSGEYDFFRGQRNTYEIQPSISRRGVDRTAATRKLNEFAHWVHNTPELGSLHENDNAILAVAQHYGLKTQLLDFSHSPEVAGFFATHGGVNGETGTIICINKKKFQKSWDDLNNRCYKDKGIFLAEIIEIDVKNLWRLQAQEGLFLKCHVTSMLLEMFSCFLHIYFPQKNGDTMLNEEKIYPKTKSHLEVLLDQYFLIDSYEDREKKLSENFGPLLLSIEEDDVREEVETFFVANNLPEIHKSWETDFANSWLREPDERYSREDNIIDIVITLPENILDIEKFEEDIFKQIQERFGKNAFSDSDRKSISWAVVSYNGRTMYIDAEGYNVEKNAFTEFAAAQMVDSIYSGMRNLPYTNNQIINAISRYLTIVQFGAYEVIEDAIGIEFSGAEVRSRGFCSGKKLRKALRDDFLSFIKPEKLNSSKELKLKDAIFCSRYVKASYVFEDFIELFVENIIPTIAAVAVEGLVIVVNPMRVDVLGES